MVYSIDQILSLSGSANVRMTVSVLLRTSLILLVVYL